MVGKETGPGGGRKVHGPGRDPEKMRGPQRRRHLTSMMIDEQRG